VERDPPGGGAGPPRLVIRVERIALPTGLRAFTERDADGVLVIHVSDKLDSRQQRAAVLEAVRASRRETSRRAVPAGAGMATFGVARLFSRRLLPARLMWARLLAVRVMLAPLGWLGRMAARARMRPGIAASWAGAAVAVVAGGAVAGLVLSTGTVPHQAAATFGSRPGVSAAASARPGPAAGEHGRRGGSRSGGAGPAPGATAGAPPARPAAGGEGSSPPAGQASAAPRPATSAAASTPAPSSSATSQPSPSPSPSASSPGAATGPCLSLVVIGLCL
jgi:hypothetical protein